MQLFFVTDKPAPAKRLLQLVWCFSVGDVRFLRYTMEGTTYKTETKGDKKIVRPDFDDVSEFFLLCSSFDPNVTVT